MLITENNCVGCPQGCVNCGRKRQEVIKCDGEKCDNYAKYQTDDGDYCEDCLEQLLNLSFNELSLNEKIEIIKGYMNVKEI